MSPKSKIFLLYAYSDSQNSTLHWKPKNQRRGHPYKTFRSLLDGHARARLNSSSCGRRAAGRPYFWEIGLLRGSGQGRHRHGDTASQQGYIRDKKLFPTTKQNAYLWCHPTIWSATQLPAIRVELVEEILIPKELSLYQSGRQSVSKCVHRVSR